MTAAKLCLVNFIFERASTVVIHDHEPFADIGDDKPSRSHFANNYRYQCPVMQSADVGLGLLYSEISGIFGFRH